MSAPIRAGRIATARFRDLLSERERAVLQSIADFRFLSTRQIEALHFTGHASALTGARACRRVLERLTKSTVLFRLDRRIGGLRAGSASFVYGLAPLGHRIVHHEADSRPRRREPSAHFLDHTLAVAQFVIDLHTVARSGDLEVMSVETEPSCWRTFSHGLAGAETLKPDLLLTLAVGDYEQHWFVEIDCASASAQAILRKCRTYTGYWASGMEQERVGLFPKVLWVVPRQKRETQLRHAIENASHLNRDLFAVVTRDAALTVATGSEA